MKQERAVMKTLILYAIKYANTIDDGRIEEFVEALQ